jgi:nucleotide-binding universal stress UspA family protein
MLIRKILVPLDGSKLAEKALPYAETFAKQFDAELILTWALQPQPLVAMSDYGAASYGTLIDQEEDEAKNYLHNLKKELREHGIRVRTAVIKGHSVADAIVDIAEQEKVDFIVKTTHGRSGLSRWIYGSVATKVLQQAGCPIFLVRVSGRTEAE